MEGKEKATENCLLRIGNLTSDPTKIQEGKKKDGILRAQGHMEVQLDWRIEITQFKRGLVNCNLRRQSEDH